MKIKIQVTIETDQNERLITEEIACLQRNYLTSETLGLTLAEAKEMLASLQETMVRHQAAEYVRQQRLCPACGQIRARKGTHQIVYRTLFGKLKLASPRLYTCVCQPQSQKSFSPLAELFPERTASELRYLQTKWASLMSYGLTINLLEEVLPIDASLTTVVRHTHQVAERLEGELGEEQFMFVEGCQRDWDNLPYPNGPLTVGIDGGYVYAREGETRKAGSFEVIVGKSVPDEGAPKRFGFVNGYDQKPKRRLFELLKAQGIQMNQAITFLSDGGDTVRNLQLYLSPQAEHILDWFHITMRLTVIKQMTHSLPTAESLQFVETDLDRVKWCLWHGNVFKALCRLDDMELDLECYENPYLASIQKLLTKLREFRGYIEANKAFIPNYEDRYRYGEVVSTAFVESTSIKWLANGWSRSNKCVGPNGGPICYFRSEPRPSTTI
jgi:hypothetical protein